MKKLLCAALAAAMLAGCAAPGAPATLPPASVSTGDFENKWADSGFVRIQLEEEMPAVTLPEGAQENAVTFGNDIICDEEDHSAEEAARHTVIHINTPGTYVVTGKLDAGQIAVDLGENAKNDPTAVVTLILDNAQIACSVAPAVIFYNVYESARPGGPAGANVILAEASWNQLIGSHTEEYDGALYSRMSMNVGGEGFLDIDADNEGLCSEMHLTVNSGTIAIDSGNDGINANEDGVSVVTINGGTLRIEVTGSTGEGDGIDSNGSIVINGGQIFAYACADSGDSGIDADLGIHLGGGTVIATGNMLDQIDENSQTYAVFSFAQRQEPGVFTLKNAAGEMVLEAAAPNEFQYLLLSSSDLTEGTYTLWSGDTQFTGVTGPGGGFFGKLEPIDRPEFPGRDDGRVEIPPQPTQPIVTHGTTQPPAQGDRPTDMPVPPLPEGDDRMPAGPAPQEGTVMPVPDLPEGVDPPRDGFGRQPIQIITGVLSPDFPIQKGANYFANVQPMT